MYRNEALQPGELNRHDDTRDGNEGLESEWPRVDVVILNWKHSKDTILCLESVLRSDYPNYRVIVCDNDSQDESLEVITAWSSGSLTPEIPESAPFRRLTVPPVKKPVSVRELDCLPTHLPKTADGNDKVLSMIQTGSNLGFAGGCNVGIAYALQHAAAYVLLLNNDACVEADAISQLVSVARDADAAIVGVRIMDDTGTRELFSGASWPAQLFHLSSSRRKSVDRTYWNSCYASGCGMLIRRDLLERRFLEFNYYFDPAYFMYCEDVDLCLFGLAHGHKCVVARDAVAHHGHAKSSGGSFNPRSYYYVTRNRILLANRWLDSRWKALFHFYYAPSRLVVLPFIRLFRWRWRTLSAVCSGMVDGYLGVIGRWKHH